MFENPYQSPMFVDARESDVAKVPILGAGFWGALFVIAWGTECWPLMCIVLFLAASVLWCRWWRECIAGLVAAVASCGTSLVLMRLYFVHGSDDAMVEQLTGDWFCPVGIVLFGFVPMLALYSTTWWGVMTLLYRPIADASEGNEDCGFR